MKVEAHDEQSQHSDCRARIANRQIERDEDELIGPRLQAVLIEEDQPRGRGREREQASRGPAAAQRGKESDRQSGDDSGQAKPLPSGRQGADGEPRHLGKVMRRDPRPPGRGEYATPPSASQRRSRRTNGITSIIASQAEQPLHRLFRSLARTESRSLRPGILCQARRSLTARSPISCESNSLGEMPGSSDSEKTGVVQITRLKPLRRVRSRGVQPLRMASERMRI